MRLIASMMLLFAFNVAAAHDHAHPKHNMVLFGENEVFASHIVYKVPHNYQVILALSLSCEDREKYLAARREHPTEQLIYLLDAMDIKDIASQAVISGTVFYWGADGQRHEIIPNMRMTNDSFKVIYFDELPLSLEP